MKEVYTHMDGARVGLCKTQLEGAGIACYVRNEAGANLAALPIPTFYPTLCVVDDTEAERAKAILASYCDTSPSVGVQEWVCPRCQSRVPAGFATCWNCESDRPAS